MAEWGLTEFLTGSSDDFTRLFSSSLLVQSFLRFRGFLSHYLYILMAACTCLLSNF